MSNKKKLIYLISALSLILFTVVLTTVLVVVLKPKAAKTQDKLVKFKIQHIFQGLGTEIAEKIVEEIKQAKPGTKVTITQADRKKEYDYGFEVADFAETKEIKPDNSTVFEIRYGRKLFSVNFEVNFNGKHFQGVNFKNPDPQNVKYAGKAVEPKTPSITKPGHNFVFKHWQLKDEMNGVYKKTVAFDFSQPIVKNIILVAYFEELFSVNYEIELENADGSFESKQENQGWFQPGSVHTVNYANPNPTIYENPVYSVSNLTVSPDSSKNRVKITLKRKTHDVNFNLVGANFNIAAKKIKHGALVGDIDVSLIYKSGYYIQEIKINGRKIDLRRLQTWLVEKTINVEIVLAKDITGKGKYPQSQSAVDISQLTLMENSVRKTYFKVNGKVKKLEFTRFFYKDSKGNKYEKFNDKYFKFEEVEFMRIPDNTAYFTKKIIDFAPYNYLSADKPISEKPADTFLNALNKDIEITLGFDTFLPTYDDSPFSVKSALGKNNFAELTKNATDYAYEVYISSAYRQQSDYLDSQIYGVKSIRKILDYGAMHWWLKTENEANEINANCITHLGKLAEQQQNYLFGVVVCKN